jgi:pyruvate/2-oxoglutarate dehydrogenase complex dihydrolipoamide acyltransferase (E2) component
MSLVEVKVPGELWPTRKWEARLIEVYVRPGDCVSKGQVVAEIEVEKAVVELTCPESGRVVEVLASPGMLVKPGQVIAKIKPEKC